MTVTAVVRTTGARIVGWLSADGRGVRVFRAGRVRWWPVGSLVNVERVG